MEETLRLWAENMRRGREALHLTQQELADLIDVRQSAVARWESGKRVPRDQHKVAIARALHQDVRQLFPLTRAVA